MTMEDTLTGKTIGKYRIEERLGRGGMAEVYKGYQESLDRHVAIKVMHTFLSAEADFLQRFKREARAMASLSHPNIVRIFDFDLYSQDSYYLVMEYIDGGTLKQELEALAEFGQRFPLEESIRMIADVADALAYAHQRGMIHRDIKPANIMLRKDTAQAVLTDFGIVKLMGDQSMAYTATGALIGTPSYMSPEQALGKPGDERVDIYSLGVLLFQMVTNQLPFAADTPLAVVMKHVNEPVPMPVTFNPDVPLDLQNVILKAMAKDPDERFQTASQMAVALRRINWSGARAEAPAPLPLEGAAALPVPDMTAPAMTMAAYTAVAANQPQTVMPAATGQTEPAAAAVVRQRRIPTWLYIAGVVLLLAVSGGALFASGLIGGSTIEPTTAPAIIAAAETETPAPTAPPETEEPTATAAPNLAATQLAQLSMDLTQEAAATNTPTYTATPGVTPSATPSPTPTGDATAAFLATCTKGVELVSATRGNTNSNAIFPASGFTARWVLANSGACPWPAGLRWRYVEGETFAYEGEPVAVGTAVSPGDRATLTAEFSSPEEVGAYESTWQLVDNNGDPFGAPVTFSFLIVPRATATATASATPSATPTAAAAAGQVAFTFSVQSCEYPGNGPEWRCRLTIFPYIDGSNATGNFTVFVFDQPSGQPAEYRGAGPFNHFIQGRRCANYNNEVRVIDDVTNTEVSRQVFVDPDEYFPGGCTE